VHPPSPARRRRGPGKAALAGALILVAAAVSAAAGAAPHLVAWSAARAASRGLAAEVRVASAEVDRAAGILVLRGVEVRDPGAAGEAPPLLSFDSLEVAVDGPWSDALLGRGGARAVTASGVRLALDPAAPPSRGWPRVLREAPWLGAREGAETRTGAALALERVDVLRPVLRIERDEAGGVRVLGAEAARIEAGPASPRGAPGLEVSRLSLREGSVTLSDRAVAGAGAPPLEARIEGIEARAQRLSSALLARPAGDAPAAPAAPPGGAARAPLPATLSLSGRAPGIAGRLRLEATLAPDRAAAGPAARGGASGAGGAPAPLPPLAGQLRASAADVRLDALAPWLAQAARVGVTAGTAALDGSVDLRAGAVTGLARLEARGVALGGPGHVSRTIPGPVPVSLERALELLRDASGRVELLVPISGEAGGPALDLAEAARAALGEAIARAVARAAGGGATGERPEPRPAAGRR
jgi:hypothetical protein